MNQAQDVVILTVKAPAYMRQQLAAWAKSNLTSMNAEVIRAIRERAERERQHREKVEAAR